MDYNRDDLQQGGLIAFLGSVAFCLLFFVYISYIHPGIDLKEVQEAAPGANTAAAPVDPTSLKLQNRG